MFITVGTGSVFYLATIVCYLLLLLHCVCGQLAKWAMLIQQMNQQEVVLTVVM